MRGLPDFKKFVFIGIRFLTGRSSIPVPVNDPTTPAYCIVCGEQGKRLYPVTDYWTCSKAHQAIALQWGKLTRALMERCFKAQRDGIALDIRFIYPVR